MPGLKGNALVAQSGGPTAVINSSACGVIQEALAQRNIGTVFAGLNGILGVLHEELFDAGAEGAEAIDALRRCPASALGSCRYKLKSLDESRAHYDRILEVFKAHDIRYFFYIGGNDSMDTADKLGKLAGETDYDLIVMGVPKTIDNDLDFTDHCPGYGSVAKYVATAAMEAGKDTEALYTSDTCTVLETMGRNAGWIAAAAGVAHRCEEDAPHLVYLPEGPFDADRFVADVKECLSRIGRCFIVASEGLADAGGNYIADQGSSAFGKDSFGHTQLGGVAEALKGIVQEQVGVKCRYIKPGTSQRTAEHFASKTDADEAYMAGRKAVQHAAEGTSGYMVTLVRESNSPYKCTTGLARLGKVANAAKQVPREWINEAGNHITPELCAYIIPLMQGEVAVDMAADGLPDYVRLKRKLVEKKTPEYEV